MTYKQIDIDNYNKRLAKQEKAQSAHYAIGVFISILAFSCVGAGLCKFATVMGV